jgi:putative ATPase
LKVFVLNQLAAEEIEAILRRALSDETKGLGKLKVEVSAELLAELAAESGGDARVALNTLELAVATSKPDENGARSLAPSDLREALQRAVALYDKAGEQHFNLISAFIKSLRNSDADATLYWLAR